MNTESTKPLIAILQPSASLAAPHRGAVKAFYHPTERGLERIELTMASSSLTRVFNALFCQALNLRGKHSITHLAMLHNDIAPDGPWLDILYDEMVATGAEVVSAVVPIKSEHALTSTAVSSPDDPWISRRLTMSEVFGLPETFGVEDVPWAAPGAYLLPNTGCFLMRFTEPWVEQIVWRFENRIVQTVDGQWSSHDIAEDWLVLGHDLHKWGKRAVCTRKVKLEHEFPRFHNRSAWGEWPLDIAYFEYRRRTEALTRDAERPWRMPEEALGWLTEPEARCLAELARDKAVLEIGSYMGRSTIAMALTAAHVHAVDPFDGRATNSPGYTFPIFMDNLQKYEVLDKVTACCGTSAAVVPQLKVEFDFAFVDGCHTKAAVLEDTRLVRSRLEPGALVAYHDYGPVDPGVIEAVDELVAGGARWVNKVETLAVLDVSGLAA